MQSLRYAIARVGGALIEWAGFNAVLLHPSTAGLLFQPTGLHVVQPTDFDNEHSNPGLLMTMALLDAMRSDQLNGNVFNAALDLGFPYEEATRLADLLKPIEGVEPETTNDAA